MHSQHPSWDVETSPASPYFVCKETNVEDGFEIPGTITDTTTGACQQAQWIRGTKKGSFDGFAFATWLKDHLAPCIPDLSPENPAMVICDGCYAHTVDEVREICAAMGILMVILPPHCTHILQGEDLYHFGVFKGAFRVERDLMHFHALGRSRRKRTRGNGRTKVPHASK